MTKKQIKTAIDGILYDLTDRRGLRQAWEGIDDDIQAEIIRAWTKIIRDAAEPETR